MGRVRNSWAVAGAGSRVRPWLVALAIVGLAACDDGPTGPNAPAGVETAVVLNSVDISLTVFPVDSPGAARAVGLASEASPTTLALRGRRAAVPLGFLPALAVVDLLTGAVETLPLPDNSGATGVAFVNDSVVYVANLNRNSVSVVNVLRGSVGPEIEVGVFPQAVIAGEGRVFVLNGELENFQPARPGRISVIDPAPGSVTATIELRGLNPGDAEFGPDGRLYVINSGTFGSENGSLSVVDVSALEEVAHHEGFGDFPSSIAFDSAGRALITSFSYGVAIWDPATAEFVRAPADPLTPGGHPSAAAAGVDSSGRVYVLVPGPDPEDPETSCTEPSLALRLDEQLEVDDEIGVGVCPIAIGFTRVEES